MLSPVSNPSKHKTKSSFSIQHLWPDVTAIYAITKTDIIGAYVFAGKLSIKNHFTHKLTLY